MAARALRADAFASVTRIIDAARRVFAAGDGSGSLSRIAHEAGVGIATLYRHFPTREVLARAVYERLFATEIEPMIVEFERSDVPRRTLLDLSERLLDVIERQPGVRSSVADLAEATGELLSRDTSRFAAAVRRAQAAGNIRPDLEPADIPNILTMAVAAFGGIASDAATRRRYLSLLLDGVNPAGALPLPPLPVAPDGRGARRG